MQDPIDEAARALQTTVGSDESALRAKLGNDGYELYFARANKLDELRVIEQGHHAAMTHAQAEYVAAKRDFWRMLALATLAIPTLATAWSIALWVR